MRGRDEERERMADGRGGMEWKRGDGEREGRGKVCTFLYIQHMWWEV